MKKQFFFMLSALAIALPLSLSLQSCGDDDDDSPVTNTEQSGGDTGSNTGGDGTSDDGTGAIDLGLPSGIKWAKCNLGASSPEEYGDYYAWGETNTKSNYSESNCTTSDYYNPYMLKSAGITDSNCNLNAKYDVASVKLGSKWRMPTQLEIVEIQENCLFTWTIQNGVYGYIVKSKKNNNSIFLPVAGYRNGTSLKDAGYKGSYWSSTCAATGTSSIAWDFYPNGYKSGGLSCRYYGRSVRPVTK